MELIDRTCPECGATNRLDRRFVEWCPSCEWNVDPDSEQPATGGRAKRARRYNERLFNDLVANEKPAVGLGRSWLLIATTSLIWASWLALVILGIWIVVTQLPNFVGLLLAAPVILVAYLLRPRFGRPGGGIEVAPNEAPDLYELVSEVCEALGAPPVDLIVIDGDFNAGIGRVGLRRRVVLTIGTPLWINLSPDERVALLAHEVAHVGNGDPRRGFFVWSAANMLTTWHDFLAPARGSVGGGLVESIAQAVVRALMTSLAWVLGRLAQAYVRLGLRDGLVAEYRSDRAAAEIAGSEAVVALLDSLLLAQTVAFAINRAVSDDADADAGWDHVRKRVEELPDHERLRLRTVAERHHHVEDESHPPTAYRRRYIEHLHCSRTMGLSDRRAQGIESQLGTHYALAWKVAKRNSLARRYH